jgi:hypothetical protein
MAETEGTTSIKNVIPVDIETEMKKSFKLTSSIHSLSSLFTFQGPSPSSCPVKGFPTGTAVLSGFIIVPRSPSFVNHLFFDFFSGAASLLSFVSSAASACCRSPRDSFYTISPGSHLINRV